jgi:hypothetical protein
VSDLPIGAHDLQQIVTVKGQHLARFRGSNRRIAWRIGEERRLTDDCPRSELSDSSLRSVVGADDYLRPALAQEKAGISRFTLADNRAGCRDADGLETIREPAQPIHVHPSEWAGGFEELDGKKVLAFLLEGTARLRIALDKRGEGLSVERESQHVRGCRYRGVADMIRLDEGKLTEHLTGFVSLEENGTDAATCGCLPRALSDQVEPVSGVAFPNDLVTGGKPFLVQMTGYRSQSVRREAGEE